VTDFANGKARFEFDSVTVSDMLKSGERLTYVLIGVTASGEHLKAGETFMFEITKPTTDASSTDIPTVTT
jgi:hypothetical protein